MYLYVIHIFSFVKCLFKTFPLFRGFLIYFRQFFTYSGYEPFVRYQFSSVQFSPSVVSDSLRPRELQHAKPPCPTPTTRAHPNSCPLSRWCHPIISSSVIPFSSFPQSFPTSASFQMNQLFASGGQSIGVSASITDTLMNTQDFRMHWLDLLAVQGTLKSQIYDLQILSLILQLNFPSFLILSFTEKSY